MKRIIAAAVAIGIIMTCFAACKGSGTDTASQYIDENGKIISADADDSDMTTYTEDNEIKTAVDGSVITVGEDAAAITGTTASLDSGSVADSNGDELPQVEINLSDKTVSNTDYAAFNGSTLFISESGDYTLTGNFFGCVYVELDYNEVARLRLVGVNIVNTSGPAIKITNLASNEENGDSANRPDTETGTDDEAAVEMNQPDAIISFIDGTTSALEVRDYSPNDMSGTIYSEVSLSIRGQGTGVIKNANQNAIHCLKSVEVKNCTLTLSAPSGRGVYTKARYENGEKCSVRISAYRDAVKCDKFYMSGGTLIACSSNNDAIDADDRAIISGGVLLADTGDVAKNYGIKVRRILEGTVRADKNDTFAVTGGTVLASGAFNTTPSADTSTQCTALLGSSYALKNTEIAICDITGGCAFAYAVSNTARPNVLVSSANFTLGGTYYIMNGADISGISVTTTDSIIASAPSLYDGATSTGGNQLGMLSFATAVIIQ